MSNVSSISSLIIDRKEVVPAGPVAPFPELAKSATLKSVEMRPLPVQTLSPTAETFQRHAFHTSSTFPMTMDAAQDAPAHHVTLSRMKKQPKTKFWEQHPWLSTLLLQRIWSSHGPWWILLKVAIALTGALALDVVTKNPDSTTATFIAWLALSDVVSNGFKQCLSVYIGALLGSSIGVGLQAGLIPLSPYAIIGAVPLAVILTIYLLFLMQRENDFGALTNGAFSALFTVIVPFTYAPLNNSVSVPLQTLVVRLIAVTEGVVCGMIANVLVSGLFYRNLFYSRHLAVANTLRFAIVDVAKDPIHTQYAFGLIESCQQSVQAALGEVGRLRGTRVKVADNQTFADLQEYEATLTTYLKLLNIYAYVGLFRSLLSNNEQRILVEILNNAYRILVEEVWGFDTPEALIASPTLTLQRSVADDASMNFPEISQPNVGQTDDFPVPLPSMGESPTRELPASLEWLVRSLDSVLLELAIDVRQSPYGGWTAKQQTE